MNKILLMISFLLLSQKIICEEMQLKQIIFLKTTDGYQPGLLIKKFPFPPRKEIVVNSSIIIYNGITIPYRALPKSSYSLNQFNQPIIYQYKNEEQYNKAKEKENVPKDSLLQQEYYIKKIENLKKKYQGYFVYNFLPKSTIIKEVTPELSLLKINKRSSLIGIFLNADHMQILYAFDKININTNNAKDRFPIINTQNSNILLKFIPIPDYYKRIINNLSKSSENLSFLPEIKLLDKYSMCLDKNTRNQFIKKLTDSLKTKPENKYNIIEIEKHFPFPVCINYKASTIRNVYVKNEYKKLELTNKNQHSAILFTNAKSLYYYFTLKPPLANKYDISLSDIKSSVGPIKISKCYVEIIKSDIEVSDSDEEIDMIDSYFPLSVDSDRKKTIAVSQINKQSGMMYFKNLFYKGDNKIPPNSFYLDILQDQNGHIVLQNNVRLPRLALLNISGQNSGLIRIDVKAFNNKSAPLNCYKPYINIEGNAIQNPKLKIYFFFKINNHYGRGVIAYGDKYSEAFQLNQKPGENYWKLTFATFLEYPVNGKNKFSKRVIDERDGF